jgi:hypothetical protein
MSRVVNASRRNRAQLRKNYPVIGAECSATAVINTSKLRVTFSAPVVVKGIPSITVNGVLPTAVTANSSTQIDLTYAASVATGQTWLAPARCAGIRTESGGYVAKSTATF